MDILLVETDLIAASSSRRRRVEHEREVAIGVETEVDNAILKGLHRYVRLVIEALGLRGDAYCAQLEPITSVYVALEGRLPERPDRDVALLWDERHGWALAVETSSGEDLIVAGHLGAGLLPPPRVVAAFARSLLAGERSGQLEPPTFDATESEGLAGRLAEYAGSVLATQPG